MLQTDIDDHFNLTKSDIEDAIHQMQDYGLVGVASGVSDFNFQKAPIEEHNKFRIVAEGNFLDQLRKKYYQTNQDDKKSNRLIHGRVFTFVSRTIYQYLHNQNRGKASYNALAVFIRGIFTQLNHNKLRQFLTVLEQAGILEFSDKIDKTSEIQKNDLTVSIVFADESEFEEKLAEL